jgi:hypothetical protein
MGAQGPAGPQGPAGQALAGADFQCSQGKTVFAGREYIFTQAPGQGNFGSSISSTAGPTGLVGQFILQPGIYQIHLDGVGFNPVLPLFPAISLFLTGVATNVFWGTIKEVNPPTGASPFIDIIGGDRLLAVTQAGAPLDIVNDSTTDVVLGACELVITRLQ